MDMKTSRLRHFLSWLLADANRVKFNDREQSGGGMAEVKCKTCGFVAFGSSPEKALVSTCNNCGAIMGEDPEASKIRLPKAGITQKGKVVALCRSLHLFTSTNYTNIVLTVIAIAICIIAYKQCVPTSPFVTWGDLSRASLAGDNKGLRDKIPVIRIQGGSIDAEVSGSVSIDR